MAGVRSLPTLGDYLLREGIISQNQLNQALDDQLNSSRSIGRILVDRCFITESLRMTVLQKQFGFDLVRLKDVRVEPILLMLIPFAFAEKHRVVPIGQDGDHTLIVAMEDPSDIIVLDAMKNQLGRPLRPVVASQEDLQLVLDQYSREQATQDELKYKAERKPILLRLARWSFLPLLMVLPLACFFGALHLNLFDLEYNVNAWFKTGALTTFDLVLYIALIWGIWSVIVYETYGLIFHRGKKAEEEKETGS